MKRLGILIACTVALFTNINGQPLADLIALVDEENLRLKSINQEYLSLLERAPQVGQLPDPEVGAGVFVRAPETRVGPQIFRLGASQMLPWKGTLQARQDVALARARVKYEEIDMERRSLVYMVKEAYFQLYELGKSQEIIRRNIRIFETLDRFTLSRVESGKSSSADVLRVQLKRQELEQELQLLENRKVKVRARLNQALSRPVDTPVTITDTLTMARLDLDRDTLGGHLNATHPAIAMLTRSQEVARKEQALNVLSGKPTFGVGLDYIMVNERKDVDIPQNGKDIIMPMARVTIPLNRTRYGAKDREEELRIAAIEDRKQDMQVLLLAEIESALSEMQDAHLKLELYEKLMRTTRATLAVLETTYSTSGQGFDELLRLQNELVTYDLKVLRAIVQSHIAKAMIERYLNS
ncbi:MAG: TolC family protein [Saprospiraceae bacterium]|nr:TolC family protein [Saprospiraceae bacterium]